MSSSRSSIPTALNHSAPSFMARISGALVQRLVQPTFQQNFPLTKQRKRLDFLQRFAPMPFGVKKTDITLSGDNCAIPAWRLTPKGVKAGTQMLYLHGGGYVSGSPQSHGDMVARIARELNISATLIDYRLAPEHPFPAALEDALAAYKSLQQDGSDIIIAGDSAGGGLTLALMQLIQQHNLAKPKALVLFSPLTDLTGSGDSFYQRADREKLLSPSWIKAMGEKYAGNRELKHPLLSPLYADLSAFPPTLIQVGEEEILFDDSIRLGEQMEKVGTSVELQRYPNMWHVFQLHAGYMPEAKKALAEIARFINAQN